MRPMKSSPLVFFAVLATSVFVHSEDEAIVESSDSPAISATAHIIGDIPDGSVLAPATPKPTLVVRAADILETRTYQQDSREIIVRKLSPDTVTPLRKPDAPPLDIASPALQQRIGETLEKRPHDALLMVGASVYRLSDGSARSYVSVWPDGRGQPVTFWSSADFGYLSGFASFVGSDGGTRSLIMAWSVIEIGDLSDLMEKRKLQHGKPDLPDLPSGKASFTLASGEAEPEILRSIQSLHDLYNNDTQRLKAAYEGRLQASRLREADLKSNPPEEKTIILNHWGIAPQEKGAAQ